jgi:hypothetical protein
MLVGDHKLRNNRDKNGMVAIANVSVVTGSLLSCLVYYSTGITTLQPITISVSEYSILQQRESYFYMPSPTVSIVGSVQLHLFFK